MADRRTEDQPTQAGGSPVEDAHPDSRRPISERVSAAVTTAGLAASNAASAAARSTHPRAGEPARASAAPRTRRARLRLVHIDPWSVMKTSFLLSIALGIVTVVSVAVVWSVLGAAGIWESINSTVTDVVGSETSSAFDIQNYLGMDRVMGFTIVVAVVDVVLVTVIATLGAFLYNLAASLLGGVEVIWAEDN